MSDSNDDSTEVSDYLTEGPDDENGDSIPENLPGEEERSTPFRSVLVQTYLALPADGTIVEGLYCTHDVNRLWGTAKTIQAIRHVGREWQKTHPNIGIGIGDISKKGGGQISGHASHRKGVDFDVRPIRKDGKEKRVTIDDAEYSKALTSELINLFIHNGIVRATHVFFNDPTLVRPPIQTWPNHRNHFHVRFEVS